MIGSSHDKTQDNRAENPPNDVHRGGAPEDTRGGMRQARAADGRGHGSATRQMRLLCVLPEATFTEDIARGRDSKHKIKMGAYGGVDLSRSGVGSLGHFGPPLAFLHGEFRALIGGDLIPQQSAFARLPQPPGAKISRSEPQTPSRRKCPKRIDLQGIVDIRLPQNLPSKYSACLKSSQNTCRRCLVYEAWAQKRLDFLVIAAVPSAAVGVVVNPYCLYGGGTFLSCHKWPRMPGDVCLSTAARVLFLAHLCNAPFSHRLRDDSPQRMKFYKFEASWAIYTSQRPPYSFRTWVELATSRNDAATLVAGESGGRANGRQCGRQNGRQCGRRWPESVKIANGRLVVKLAVKLVEMAVNAQIGHLIGHLTAGRQPVFKHSVITSRADFLRVREGDRTERPRSGTPSAYTTLYPNFNQARRDDTAYTRS
ncbi:hypothetical protein C8R44DRAFT_752332 [Mycena epipterygia]|nr:hypothetical protein C8R44DRAFT_752332 [Mycena epipterygia]